MTEQQGITDSSAQAMPEQLGHYEIIEKVGQGGMAVVYKGRQPSLNRLVAIKVLPPQFVATPELLGRFDREASIVAQLNHSNIVQVIDRGKEGDLVYIVMEYVEGAGLDGLIRQGGLDTAAVVAYAMQICDGLAYAHGMGVVHRDLKPSNILKDERSGRIKIADFGIAQIEDSGGIVATLTRDNAAIGTMNYMSPEQRLDAHAVNHLTDIYSFGVILYEMLIGKPPMGHFKLPSVVRPDIPLGFDNIIRKCLCESPSDRYQSAGAIRHDLAKLAGRHQKQEDGSGGGSVLSLQRLNKRQRWSAIGGVAGAVLAVAVVVVILATRERPEQSSPEGVAGAAGNPGTVSAVEADLRAEIAHADGLIAGDKLAEAIELLAGVLQKHPQAPQAAQVQFTIAATYYDMGEKEKCKLEYQRLERNYPQSPLVPASVVGRCQAEWDTAPRKGLLIRVARDIDAQKRLIEELHGLLVTWTNMPATVESSALKLIAQIAEPPEMADFDLAVTSLLKLHALDKNGGREALRHAAELCDRKLEAKQRALTLYRKLLAEFPDDPNAGTVRKRIDELATELAPPPEPDEEPPAEEDDGETKTEV